MEAIDLNKVVRAYEGKVGCMCGCLGNYWATRAMREEAGAARGYPLTDNEVSDAKVMGIVAAINREIELGERKGVEFDIGEQYAYVRIGKRCLAAYFKEER